MTSIAAERAALLEVGLRLRRRDEWGAVFDYTNARAVDEPAVHQFVHITVTDPANYPSNDAHARAIERIGIARFPATGISYNRLILPGGHPYEGQPIGRRAAHTVNEYQRATCTQPGCPSLGRSLEAPSWNLNVNGRGYGFARNCGDPITAADLDAMARCLAGDRLAGFVTRTATLHGHRCAKAKDCPCEPAWGLMGEIDNRMRAYLARGNVTEDDMPTPAEIADATWDRNLVDDGATHLPGLPNDQPRDAETILRRVRGDVAQLLARPAVTRVTLSPEDQAAIAAALAGEVADHLADAVADKLAARLQA